MSLQVSVVVPSYNRGKLIRPTLDSILAQTHRPSEIVVVDDGSTDDTEMVVAQYGDSVKYVRIENSGPPRARNAGVAQSTAPWLAFCDSDDLWHPEKLRLQVRLFDAMPDLAYSFTNCRTVVDGRWADITKFDSLPNDYWNLKQRNVDTDLFVVEESMFGRLLVRQPIFPSTVMMKRAFFETVGGWQEPLGRNPAEDVEFHLRCVDQARIGVVRTAVVGIRKHDCNFSRDSLRSRIGDVEMLRFVRIHNPAATKYASIIKERIIAASSYAAEGAFAIGDVETMKKLLKEVPLHKRTWKLQVKSLVAHCPSGVSKFLMDRLSILS